MYRIEGVLIVLALLPLIMAILFKTAVVPTRKRNMIASLNLAKAATGGDLDSGEVSSVTTHAIDRSISRVKDDFESQYSTRFFLPAVLLSFFYVVGLSLGTSYLLADGKCSALLCRKFDCFKLVYLLNPVYAVLGSYVFNTSMIVQRSFIGDVTKNVFWASLNRLIFSVGFSIALYAAIGPSLLASFGIAFFPGIAVTWLRKTVTKVLGITSPTVQELEIQLVQGIDIWKEDRLEEEGIESVQNLATADIFSLAVKTHYPLRTIVDWMDQAILIQRFPGKLQLIQQAGLPVSAIDFAWIGDVDKDGSLAKLIGEKLAIEGPIVAQAMESLSQDTSVRILWRLWQSWDLE